MSKYLDQIIAGKNQICHMQIVFVDIVKYSKRKTARQVELINAFTKLVERSLTETNKQHFDTLTANNHNLKSDSILIPTGDGIAVAMPFEWIKTLHLDLALNILRETSKLNQGNDCKIFTSESYCDCHNNLNVRIGIATGLVILYKDINSNYNVAGNVINMAARVMNCGTDNQIMFTKNAYLLFSDLSTDSKTFIEHKNKEIKHGLSIDLYQYLDKNIPYLNSDVSQAPLDYSDEEVNSNEFSDLVEFVHIDLSTPDLELGITNTIASKDITISKCLITQGIFQEIMGYNPSSFKGDNRPVESVTWVDCVEFCNKLSAFYDMDMLYEFSSDKKVVKINSSGNGFRLPFMSEYDYMSKKAFTSQDTLIDFAVIGTNETKNVATKSPDNFGIFDLLGNVWEWCSDISVNKDPDIRVVHGGSYSNFKTQLSRELKQKRDYLTREDNIGFRIVKQS